jgi:hypothetical protein
MEWPKEGVMRIFWWQGGLQIQPENEVEAEALLYLVGTAKYERPPDDLDGRRTTARPDSEALGQVERGLDLGL